MLSEYFILILLPSAGYSCWSLSCSSTIDPEEINTLDDSQGELTRPLFSGSEGLLNLDEEELFFFMELIFKAEPILMKCLKKD